MIHSNVIDNPRVTEHDNTHPNAAPMGSALRSDFARGQRAIPARLRADGDFATGVRTARAATTAIGDFATGMRTVTTPVRVGDFATGMRVVSAPVVAARPTVADQESALLAA